MEYKTANDFYFREKCQDIWDYYTPTGESPRPHRFHLFVALRKLGWTVLGLNEALASGTSVEHDRMTPIVVGHGAFIPRFTVNVFRNVLDLRRKESESLACALVRHQALATDKIMSIVFQLRRAPSATGQRLARTASHHMSAGTIPARGVG